MENIKQARDFHKYKVWQDAVNYATDVYKVTSSMPWFEKKDCAINCKGQLYI